MKKNLLTVVFALASALAFAGAEPVSKIDACFDKCRTFMSRGQLDSLRHYAGMALKLAVDAGNDEQKAKAWFYLAEGSYQIVKNEALDYYINASFFARRSKAYKVLIQSNLNCGAIYRTLGRFDSTRFFYEEAVDAAQSLLKAERSATNLKLLGMVYNNYGVFYIRKGDFLKGIEYMRETESIAREVKDTQLLLRSLNNIGTIYSDLCKPGTRSATGATRKKYLQTSIEYYHEALKYLIYQRKREIGALMMNIGSSYNLLEKLDSAIYYNMLAVGYFKEISHTEAICGCYLNVGSAYNELNRPEKAKESYLKAIEAGEVTMAPICLSQVYNNIGKLLLDQKNYTESEKYLSKALDLRNSVKGNRVVNEIYDNLHRLYAALGDYKKALEYHRQYVALTDSVNDVQHMGMIDDIEVKYEVGVKEKVIDDLSTQKQLLEARNKTAEAELRTRNVIIAAILLIFALLGTILWFWFTRKQLIQQQRALDTEYRLLRAQMNPHFLFNGLNTIQKHYTEGHLEEANRFMGDFSRYLRLILNKTGEISHTLDEELEFTRLYVQLEQQKYPGRIEYETEIEPGIDVSYFNVPTLIFQPLVENAIWHGILPAGRNGKITIRISVASDMLTCVVEDNGVGIQTSGREGHTSKATGIIAKRLGAGSSFKIENIVSDDGSIAGTRVTLIFGQIS